MPDKAQALSGGAKDEASGLQRVIAALASPIRREILALVWDQELPAGQIAAAFPVTKPTISQHLAVLRDAGLVIARAAGTSRRFRARQQALQGLHAALGPVSESRPDQGAGQPRPDGKAAAERIVELFATTATPPAGMRGPASRAGVVKQALTDPGKWSNAGDVPERALAAAATRLAVVASTDVPAGQAQAFAAFTDPALYSRWLGVPVTIDDGRFAATMEWGTQVRGRYELVCPPELIVMRWDFEDGNIPVPGAELTGYLRVTPRGAGAHVEVHQLAGTPAQAAFLESAWAMVLGRFTAGVAAALDPGVAAVPRPARPKQRHPADGHRGPS